MFTITTDAKRLKDLNGQIYKAIARSHSRALALTSENIQEEWGEEILNQLAFSTPPRSREFIKIRRGRHRDIHSPANITVDSANLTGFSISPKKRAISLRHFNTKQVSSGVQVKIRSNAKVIKHAFIARMPKRKHAGIYKRVGKSRLPIREIRWTTGIESIANRFVLKIQKQNAQLYSQNFVRFLEKELRNNA